MMMMMMAIVSLVLGVMPLQAYVPSEVRELQHLIAELEEADSSDPCDCEYKCVKGGKCEDLSSDADYQKGQQVSCKKASGQFCNACKYDSISTSLTAAQFDKRVEFFSSKAAFDVDGEIDPPFLPNGDCKTSFSGEDGDREPKAATSCAKPTILMTCGAQASGKGSIVNTKLKSMDTKDAVGILIDNMVKSQPGYKSAVEACAGAVLVPCIEAGTCKRPDFGTSNLYGATRFGGENNLVMDVPEDPHCCKPEEASASPWYAQFETPNAATTKTCKDAQKIKCGGDNFSDLMLKKAIDNEVNIVWESVCAGGIGWHEKLKAASDAKGYSQVVMYPYVRVHRTDAADGMAATCFKGGQLPDLPACDSAHKAGEAALLGMKERALLRMVFAKQAATIDQIASAALKSAGNMKKLYDEGFTVELWDNNQPKGGDPVLIASLNKDGSDCTGFRAAIPTDRGAANWEALMNDAPGGVLLVLLNDACGNSGEGVMSPAQRIKRSITI